jgi:transposase
MVPGDSYDFNKVHKLFGKQYYTHDEIKEASVNFYNKYGWVDNCDTYQEGMSLPYDEKQEYLNLFMDEFKKFVKTKFEKTNDYQKNVFNTKLTFRDNEVSKLISFNEDAEIDVRFTFDVVPLEKILTGKLNWECCYIGYESTVSVNGDYNISSLIRWLSMFGYVYQQRIWPSYKVHIDA